MVKITKTLYSTITAFLVAQWYRICLHMQEAQVRSLQKEDPLEKDMATHYNILAWDISWTKEPGRLQSMWSQKIQKQASN